MTRPPLGHLPGVFGVSLLALALGGRAPAAEPGVPAQTVAINEAIAAKWKEGDIKKPAARATDLEFLRRVYVDLIGRIATPEEVLDFERDAAPNKRGRLVKRLLTDTKFQPKPNGAVVKVDGKATLQFDYADEFADHWADLWTIWLMSRSVEPRYREQMRVWLQAELLKEVNHKDMTVAILTATGQSNENGAVNFVAVQLGEKNAPEKQGELGTFDAVPVTSRVTRLFLGLQTQCTQCHDHPFNKEWVQSDFWGVNAFFRQVGRSGDPTPKVRARNMMNTPLVKLTLDDATGKNADGRVYYERRDGQLKSSKAVFLKHVAQADKGEKSDKFLPTGTDAKSRREALAQFVVSHDNFSKAYVNRIWGHLFGRGLNKDATIDDFGSHNEVVHPEMLSKLAEEFAKYNYNPKLLLEWICNSDAYQLSHVATKEHADPKFDVYFARMPLKAMSPETLYESMATATKAESAKGGDDKARKLARENWLDKLVDQFGDDEGNELVFNGTIVQALLMMNGKEINTEIGAGGSNPVQKLVAKYTKSGVSSPDAIVDELFLMTLNRHPTGEEKTRIKSLQLKGAIVKGEAPAAVGAVAPKAPVAPKLTPATPTKAAPPAKGKPPVIVATGVVAPSAPGDVSFYQDLMWALMNTNEFMLNH